MPFETKLGETLICACQQLVVSSSRAQGPECKRLNHRSSLHQHRRLALDEIMSPQSRRGIQSSREHARVPDMRALDRKLDQRLDGGAIAALERYSEPRRAQVCVVPLIHDPRRVALELRRPRRVVQAQVSEPA